MGSTGDRGVVSSQCSVSLEADMANLLGQIKEKDRKIGNDLAALKLIVTNRLPSLIDSVQLNEASVKGLLELTEFRDTIFKQFINEAGRFVCSLEKSVTLANQWQTIDYPVEDFGVEHGMVEDLFAKVSHRLDEGERCLSAAQDVLIASERDYKEVSTKLAKVENHLSEVEDELKHQTEQESSIDKEIPELERQASLLDTKLAEIQRQIDDQSAEQGRRTKLCQQLLADVEQQYEAICMEIAEEKPKRKHRANSAKQRLDEILGEIEAISKKMIACNEEKEKITEKISHIEQNTLSVLRARRDAASEAVAKLVASIEPLRNQADTFGTLFTRLEQIVARVVHASYARADYLNGTLATLNEEAITTQQKVADTPTRLRPPEWPRQIDDYVLDDPRMLLHRLTEVQQALKPYQRNDVDVKHSTAQTDFQFIDVSELERISRDSLCEVTAREINELTKSLEQIEAGKRKNHGQQHQLKQREVDSRMTGEYAVSPAVVTPLEMKKKRIIPPEKKSAVPQVDFNKLPTFGRNDSAQKLTTSTKLPQDFNRGYARPPTPMDHVTRTLNTEAIVISSDGESSNREYAFDKLVRQRSLFAGPIHLRSVKQELPNMSQRTQVDGDSSARTHMPAISFKQDNQPQFPVWTTGTPATSAANRAPDQRWPSTTNASEIRSSSQLLSPVGLRPKRQMALASIRASFRGNVQSPDDAEWLPPSEQRQPAKKARKSEQGVTTTSRASVLSSRVKPRTSAGTVQQGATKYRTQTSRAPKQGRLLHSDVSLMSTDNPIVSLLDSD